ncbi:MAG: YihY/virulence factor BrkB family protein, partial [Candidatus Binataceae bacterium]
AYTTLFALPSMLLIVIYVAGLVLGPHAASGEIEARLSGAMGAQAAAEIQQMVANIASNRTGGIIATLAGTAGLLLSATGLLAQLQTCLNRAWKVTVVSGGFRNFLMRRLRSGILLVGAGAVAIISVAASSIIAGVTRMLPFAALVEVGELATSMLIFVVIFAGILKVMPDVRLRWGDVWVGGLFIAALFVGGNFLIGLYLGRAGKASIYGAAGSLAIILLWTYYSFLIFLLGVEFTQVWVRRGGHKVVPKEGAVFASGAGFVADGVQSAKAGSSSIQTK